MWMKLRSAATIQFVSGKLRTLNLSSLVIRYQTAQEINDGLLKLKSQLGIIYDASDLSRFMQTYFGKPDSNTDA
jgi:hypothetical protein